MNALRAERQIAFLRGPLWFSVFSV